jgi:hypothetical protein
MELSGKEQRLHRMATVHFSLIQANFPLEWKQKGMLIPLNLLFVLPRFGWWLAN